MTDLTQMIADIQRSGRIDWQSAAMLMAGIRDRDEEIERLKACLAIAKDKVGQLREELKSATDKSPKDSEYFS